MEATTAMLTAVVTAMTAAVTTARDGYLIVIGIAWESKKLLRGLDSGCCGLGTDPRKSSLV